MWVIPMLGFLLPLLPAIGGAAVLRELLGFAYAGIVTVLQPVAILFESVGL